MAICLPHIQPIPGLWQYYFAEIHSEVKGEDSSDPEVNILGEKLLHCLNVTSKLLKGSQILNTMSILIGENEWFSFIC